jgi:2-methylaconitate isomerase
MSALKIPAVYMRGGTSKGLFFHKDDLPSEVAERDRVILSAMGSPDRFGKQIDGMGGATSSTSKVVLISRSDRADCDVDFLFGQVAIDRPMVDWSGSCGNLSAAVGPFALSEGLVGGPQNGIAVVRIWQVNLGRRLIAYVPMQDGAVLEEGDFAIDGVPRPGAEIAVDFLDPGGAEQEGIVGKMFPTGNVVDKLQVPALGVIEATLIDAGMPTMIVHASAFGLTGIEMQHDIDTRPDLLNVFESARAQGAVAMGLADNADDATANRPHTPKISFIAGPRPYRSSGKTEISAEAIDLVARIISMGRLHHAMTGTGAVALAAAAAIPGTLVHKIVGTCENRAVRIGHPAGRIELRAELEQQNPAWKIAKVQMSRSAREIMRGIVSVPAARA